MRRLPALLLLVTVIVALAACAGANPGWTYAPASAAPAASGGASAEPSGGASAAPSGGASAAPSAAAPSAEASAGASGGTGTALTVTAPVGAATSGFSETTLTAPANTAFQLTFDNQDNQAPHNLVLLNPDGTTKVAVQGDTAFFQGPGQRVYQVPALAAGDYPYKCEVHPTSMKGTITVK